MKTPKVKKDKSERHGDDEHHHRLSKPSNHPHKEKEKDKDKSRAARLNRKKKAHGDASPDHVSHASSEVHSVHSQGTPEESPDIHHHLPHPHRTKSRKTSKKCEEMVGKAVADFFDCAWLACAERFFCMSAPEAVSCELRNTWLRIVEAEWHDREINEKPYTKNNRIFKKDEPPLPLAFDSWSGGALETLPHHRRESVLDPFLRDAEVLRLTMPKKLPSMMSPSVLQLVEKIDCTTTSATEVETYLGDDESLGETDKKDERRKSSGNMLEPKTTSATSQGDGDGDKWDPSLDQTFSQMFKENVQATQNESPEWTTTTVSTVNSPLSSGGAVKEHSIRTVLSARMLALDGSTTDVGYSSHNSDDRSSKRSDRSGRSSYRPPVVKKFSPSQCGGRAGSRMGIFRLPHETTEEVLFRREYQEERRLRRASEGEDSQDYFEDQEITFSTMGLTSQMLHGVKHEPKLVVLPLFEERTPRSESSHRILQNVSQPPSHTDTRFKVSGENLFKTSSDTNKQFMTRTLANLNNRFKRQAIRALAARIKRAEERLKNRRSSSSSQFSGSRSSALSSSNRTNRTNKTPKAHRSKSKGRKRGTNMGSVGRSASEFDITKETGQNIFYTAIRDSGLSGSQGTTTNKNQGYRSNFKAMGNVRRINHPKLVDRFTDKPSPAELQARFGNGRKFSRGSKDGGSDGREDGCPPWGYCLCQPYVCCVPVKENKNDCSP